MEGSRLKIQSVEELEELANSYFNKCDTDKRPYTTSGLAHALNITRKTLNTYNMRGDYGAYIDYYRGRIETQMEERMLTGQSAAVPSIFSLKNNLGWEDKTKVEYDKNLTIKSVKELSTSKLLRMMNKNEVHDVQKESKAALEIELVTDDNNQQKSIA